MDRHLIDEIVFDLSFDAQASFEHQDDIRAFVCDRLLPVIDEVCSAHADPASVLRLGALEIDLGDVPADNVELEMARRLRSKLDDILAGIRRSPTTSTVKAERISRHQAEFEQLAYFLLHGSLPWQSDADDARAHERLMESVLTDGAELAALLKRSPRAHRERMVERLARQFGPRHLETVLRQLEPAQADSLLATMNDLQAAMAEAGISFDAGMLWQQAMLGASEISGKSFDAALLLDMALRQIAAAHGEAPAAIGKTLLGAAQRLYREKKTGAQLAELLEAARIQGEPDDEEMASGGGRESGVSPDASAGEEAQHLHHLRQRLAQAMLRGDAATIANDWSRIVREQPAMLAEALRRYASREDAIARIAAGFTQAMISDLLHAASPALAALAAPLEQGAAAFWKAAGESGAEDKESARRRWQVLLLTQAVSADGNAAALRVQVQETVRGMAAGDSARAASIVQAWRDAAAGTHFIQALDEVAAQLPKAPPAKGRRGTRKTASDEARSADDIQTVRNIDDSDTATQAQDTHRKVPTGHASQADAARRSEAVLEGQDLFELLWQAAQGESMRPDGAPLVAAIDVLARRHPLQLNRLFRQWRQLPSVSATRLPAAVFQRLAQALIEQGSESDAGDGSDGVTRRAFVESISARAAEAEDMDTYFRAVFDNLLHKRPLDLDALVHGVPATAVSSQDQVDEDLTHAQAYPAPDGRLLRDLLDSGDETKSREAARLLVERKSPVLKTWLEQSPVAPRRTAKLARLLPESMLARLLVWLHGAEHARVEESAQRVTDAFSAIAASASDAETTVWKWEYVLEDRFGRREAFEPQRFARGLAAHLARRAGGDDGLAQAAIELASTSGSPTQAESADGKMRGAPAQEAGGPQKTNVASDAGAVPGTRDVHETKELRDTEQLPSRTPAEAEAERAAMIDRMRRTLPAGNGRDPASADEARSALLLEGHELYERWQQRVYDGAADNIAPVIEMLAARHPLQFRRVLRGLRRIGTWESLPLSVTEWRALAHAGAAAMSSAAERAEWKALLSAEPEQHEDASTHWRALLDRMLAGVPAAEARDGQVAEEKAGSFDPSMDQAEHRATSGSEAGPRNRPVDRLALEEANEATDQPVDRAADQQRHQPAGRAADRQLPSSAHQETNRTADEQRSLRVDQPAADATGEPAQGAQNEPVVRSADDRTLVDACVRSEVWQESTQRARFVQAVERLLATDAAGLSAAVEGKPERIARIVDALPERLLTRWLRLLRPEVHAAMHAIADDVTEAFVAQSGYGTAADEMQEISPHAVEEKAAAGLRGRIIASAWRHMLADAIGEASFTPESFAQGLADRLVRESEAPARVRQAMEAAAGGMAKPVAGVPGADGVVSRETAEEQAVAHPALRRDADVKIADSSARSEDIVQAYDAFDLLLRALTPEADAMHLRVPEDELVAAIETLGRHLPLLRRFFRELRGVPVKARAFATVWQALVRIYLKRVQVDSGAAMLGAIDTQGQEAVSQRIYWREVLLCLLEERALDLEALSQLDDLPDAFQPADVPAAGTGFAPEAGKLAIATGDVSLTHEDEAKAHAEPMTDEALLRTFLDGDAPADTLAPSMQSSLREAAGRLVEFKSPAMKAWLEQSPQTARKAVKLARLLPESVLTRIVLWLRGGEHAQVQESADCVVDALLELEEGISEKDVAAWKWEYILTERFEKRSSFEPGAFMQGLTDMLAECLSEQGATGIEALRREAKTRAAVAYRKLEAAHAAAARDAEKPKSGTSGEALAYRTATEEEPLETIYIANAGQVLAAPYLPRLFQMLNLVDKGRFVDRAAAERAAHLLQFMVDERTESPEHQLALNKILCGIKSGVPIVRGIEITDAEKETVEGLLKGMIENWKAIGNTSVAGLRESFLRREGWLRLKEDAWHLEVLPGTFDMLLDRLPWGFSIIRHPWMERAVHVSWR